MRLLRSLSLVAVGVVGGFVAAHFVNQTPRGHALFERINDFGTEFAKAVREGYRARTEAIYAAIESGQDAHR